MAWPSIRSHSSQAPTDELGPDPASADCSTVGRSLAVCRRTAVLTDAESIRSPSSPSTRRRASATVLDRQLARVPRGPAGVLRLAQRFRGFPRAGRWSSHRSRYRRSAAEGGPGTPAARRRQATRRPGPGCGPRPGCAGRRDPRTTRSRPCRSTHRRARLPADEQPAEVVPHAVGVGRAVQPGVERPLGHRAQVEGGGPERPELAPARGAAPGSPDRPTNASPTGTSPAAGSQARRRPATRRRPARRGTRRRWPGWSPAPPTGRRRRGRRSSRRTRAGPGPRWWSRRAGPRRRAATGSERVSPDSSLSTPRPPATRTSTAAASAARSLWCWCRLPATRPQSATPASRSATAAVAFRHSANTWSSSTAGNPSEAPGGRRIPHPRIGRRGLTWVRPTSPARPARPIPDPQGPPAWPPSTSPASSPT